MANIVGLRRVCGAWKVLGFLLCGHISQETHTKMRRRRHTVTMTSADLRWLLTAAIAVPVRRRVTHTRPTYTARGRCRWNCNIPSWFVFIRHFYSVGGNFTPRTPPWKYRPLYESQSTTLRWLKALSLDIVVEMKFRSADDICGATLVIYCISSQCTSGFDCQKHAIPYALIRQRPVATMEIRHCRTLIYIIIMNNIAWLSIIFSLTTTNDHYPIPHICNKFLILNGMIIHAI